MLGFKAIELDATTRQRTGRQHALEAGTRQAAIEALLGLLGTPVDGARIDPSRTLVQIDAQLWIIVASQPTPSNRAVQPSLRRAGAKHKRVR
ncbi:MAG TPA: hypothetical protein VF937_06120 [Chloroflexota bacterium]